VGGLNKGSSSGVRPYARGQRNAFEGLARHYCQGNDGGLVLGEHPLHFSPAEIDKGDLLQVSRAGMEQLRMFIKGRQRFLEPDGRGFLRTFFSGGVPLLSRNTLSP